MSKAPIMAVWLEADRRDGHSDDEAARADSERQEPDVAFVGRAGVVHDEQAREGDDRAPDHASAAFTRTTKSDLSTFLPGQAWWSRRHRDGISA